MVRFSVVFTITCALNPFRSLLALISAFLQHFGKLVVSIGRIMTEFLKPSTREPPDSGGLVSDATEATQTNCVEARTQRKSGVPDTLSDSRDFVDHEDVQSTKEKECAVVVTQQDSNIREQAVKRYARQEDSGRIVPQNLPAIA